MLLFIPKMRLRSSQFPKWFSADLRHQFKCLKTRRRKYARHPTVAQLESLMYAETDFQESSQQAKAQYERDLLSTFVDSRNPNIYKYTNFIKKGGTIPSTVFLEQVSATSDIERASLFNGYFHSVFTHSSYILPTHDNLPNSESPLSSFEITNSEVFSILSSLDTSKASSLDDITPGVLKYCAVALCEPLQHLFSSSLAKHVIPADWKIHCITPVHKSGDRANVKNYRPISLLSPTSKVLERIIYNKCVEFLNEKISPAQFGFLGGRSTLQQLLLFYNEIH